jgi:hypothetical protein
MKYRSCGCGSWFPMYITKGNALYDAVLNTQAVEEDVEGCWRGNPSIRYSVSSFSFPVVLTEHQEIELSSCLSEWNWYGSLYECNANWILTVATIGGYLPVPFNFTLILKWTTRIAASGCAIFHAVSSWLLTANAQVQYQGGICKICCCNILPGLVYFTTTFVSQCKLLFDQRFRAY